MENPSEIAEVLDAICRLRDERRRGALATIVAVRGSAYRRPGARLLLTDRGEPTGNLSGGCLECNGAIDVFVEPAAGNAGSMADAVRLAREEERGTAVATVVRSSVPEIDGGVRCSSTRNVAARAGSATLPQTSSLPMPRPPLWRPIVVEHQKVLLDERRFPAAAGFVLTEPGRPRRRCTPTSERTCSS